MTLVPWFITYFSTFKLEKYQPKYKKIYYSSLKKNKQGSSYRLRSIRRHWPVELGIWIRYIAWPNAKWWLRQLLKLSLPCFDDKNRINLSEGHYETSKLSIKVVLPSNFRWRKKKRIIDLLSWPDFVSREK